MPLVKILARHSLTSIEHSIRYVLNEGKSMSQTVELIQPFLQNLRSAPTDVKALADEIIENEGYRKLTNHKRVFMFHEILSFGASDKQVITPKILQEITLKYIELRGDDLVCLAIPHFNTESAHCHIISGGTRYRDSVSSGLRKAELHRIKQELETYVQQNHPQLEHSTIEHGQGKVYQYEIEQRLHAKGTNLKQQIKELVLAALQSSRSKLQFVEKLNEHGLLSYERNLDGQITGVVSQTGRKYRFKTLGISVEHIQELETIQEVSREEILLKRLENIQSKRQNQQDLEREQ